MTSHYDAALPERAVQELAAATAALVEDRDVIGTVTNLLAGCVRCLDAAGSGIVLARPEDQQLEFLAGTSHRAEDIELYQVQMNEGPAVDTIASNEPVVAGGGDIAGRWPELAGPFHARGYLSVYAQPMHWQGQTLGALNLFFDQNVQPDAVAPVAQAFADIASIAIIHSGRVSTTDVITRLRGALAGRIVVEQAKGVLAYRHQETVDEAFAQLLNLAAERGQTLSRAAADIVADAAANRA
jgi:hypothetical protein